MLNINANVSIIVNGLAICHYHNGFWEFLMPREIGDHKLKIIVRKFLKDGSDKTHETPVADTVTKIAVETDNKIEPLSAKEFNFAGGADNHELDARWILDIKELYGKPVKLNNASKKKYTYLTVAAGTLYNRRFPLNPFVEIRDAGSSIKSTRVSQAAGIDIQWANGSGKTEIKNLSDGNSVNLISDTERDEKVLFYEIEFDNNCDRSCAGDLTDYKHYNHDLIAEAKKFDIFSVRAFAKRNKSISDVNKILEDLFEDSEMFKCRDAPCFLGECSDIEGINSLAELL